MKYIRKPCYAIIDAIKFTGTNQAEIAEFILSFEKDMWFVFFNINGDDTLIIQNDNKQIVTVNIGNYLTRVDDGKFAEYGSMHFELIFKNYNGECYETPE